MNVLRVLDPPPQAVPFGAGRAHLFDYVENFAVRAVADRVHAELEPMRERDLRELGDILDGRGGEAHAVGAVRVRLQQPRAA